MGQVIVDDNSLSAIASAIRTKLNVTTTYTPSEMATAISGIVQPSGTLPITINNTTYDVSSYARARVEITEPMTEYAVVDWRSGGMLYQGSSEACLAYIALKSKMRVWSAMNVYAVS